MMPKLPVSGGILCFFEAICDICSIIVQLMAG